MKLICAMAALMTAVPLWAQPDAGREAGSPAADTLIAVRLNHPEFEDPRALSVDPFGNIFVVDAGKGVVMKLAPTGHFDATLGGPGSREGEFDAPSDVDPTNGMVIFVADAGNRRVQRFSRTFAYLGSIPLHEAHRSADASRPTYRRRDSDVDGFSSGTPAAVSSTSADELFVIDSDRNVVVKLSEDRTLLRVIGGLDGGEGRLIEPMGLAATGDLLYVMDRDAVRIYDLFGTHVRNVSIRGVRAIAVREGILHAALASEIRTYGPAGLERTSIINLPGEIRDIALARDGGLLVLTEREIYTVSGEW